MKKITYKRVIFDNTQSDSETDLIINFCCHELEDGHMGFNLVEIEMYNHSDGNSSVITIGGLSFGDFVKKFSEENIE